mgnify:CR=1 FL=1
MGMIRRSDIEIMAPVGSYEALNAAIAAGANSVYFGVEQLNMRAASSAREFKLLNKYGMHVRPAGLFAS